MGVLRFRFGPTLGEMTQGINSMCDNGWTGPDALRQAAGQARKQEGTAMRYGLAWISALGLAGCVEGGAPPSAEAECGAADLQGLVGQPRAAFDDSAVDGPVRVLPPGSMMTMDHRPERLNLELDEAGRITRVWCG